MVYSFRVVFIGGKGSGIELTPVPSWHMGSEATLLCPGAGQSAQ
jgi:hypothetical protein